MHYTYGVNVAMYTACVHPVYGENHPAKNKYFATKYLEQVSGLHPKRVRNLLQHPQSSLTLPEFQPRKVTPLDPGQIR